MKTAETKTIEERATQLLVEALYIRESHHGYVPLLMICESCLATSQVQGRKLSQ